jgi:Fe-S-cluster-containing hydrogenase component 2
MDALSMVDALAVLETNRCIGCGLCVTTCPSGALTITRKPPELQLPVPKNQREAFILRAKARAEAQMEIIDKMDRYKKL